MSNHHPYKTLTKMAKQNGNTEPEQPNLAEAIGRLRALFEVELTKNPDLYHPVDIDRVRTEDWQVKRFLLYHPESEQAAFQALLKALQWKKSFGVHDRSDAYFPREWWLMSGAQIVGRDHLGRLVHWGAIRRLVKFKQPRVRQLTLQYIAHINERVDAMAGEQGFIIVSDAAGGSLANVDLENARFTIDILEHYPLGPRAVYCVNLPWILNSIMKLVMALTPARLKALVHFISIEELAAIVEGQYVPLALKGQRTKDYYPPGLVPLRERLEELQFDERVLNMIKDVEET